MKQWEGLPPKPRYPLPCHMTMSERDVTHLVIPEQWLEYHRCSWGRKQQETNLPEVKGLTRFIEWLFHNKRLKHYDKVRQDMWIVSYEEKMEKQMDELKFL